MSESLYVAAELYDNHGLSLKDFEGVNGPNQGAVDTVDRVYDEYAATAMEASGGVPQDVMKAWTSVVTPDTADQFSLQQNHALFGLPQFADVRSYVEKHIRQWTGVENITLIRSWYLEHTKGTSVHKHHHHYPIEDRTVSGVFYVLGQSNPLCITPNFEDVLKIENKPGQLILFDGWVKHWVEPYKYDTPRISISFDYRINGQPMCECEPTGMCFKCITRKVDRKKHFKEGTYFRGHTLDYMIK